MISLLALLIALWSAFSSHRSRRAAERSAGLTEQHRREEQAPSVEYVGTDAAPEEGIRIVNPAAIAYIAVRFTIVPSLSEPTLVQGLRVDDYEDLDPEVGPIPRWISEGQRWNLGPLGPGEQELLDLQRPTGRPGWPTTGGTLRMILDCTTEKYTVSVIRTCDIPPRPPEPFVSYG
jgi:hypothetical protein